MNKYRIDNHLSAAEIASLKAPIETAGTLPARCFVDEDFYALEIEHIFSRHWMAVLFDSDVPQIGDQKPFELCGIPLLAVRSAQGDINVFHNICPYDGCLAVIDETSAGQIVTPYHGWVYSLEGKLEATPFWDGTHQSPLTSLQDKAVDLAVVPSKTFLNTVFVNLSPTPVPFADAIHPVHSVLSEYDLSNAHPGVDALGKVLVSESSVAANWKTHLENACINVLHENFVHAGYRTSPEIPRVNQSGEKTFTAVVDRRFFALSYKRKDFLQTYPVVDVPHLGVDPQQQPETETFGTLYPNFYVSASSQFIEVGYALPDGPERTSQRMIYLYAEEVAHVPATAELRAAVAAGFAAAAEEDARICEAIQTARRSPAYSQKFYSPFWDQMHYQLNRTLLEDLGH